MKIHEKVSILMPVRNEEKYIEESVQSILNQTYKNYELIIVDDGSTDDTLDILKKYNSFSNITVFPTSGIGKNAALNLAFKNSTGRYICYFAGDDVMYPDSIELRVELISRSSNQEILLLSKLKILSDDKKHDGQILPKNPLKGNVTGGSLMFTRSLSSKIFPLPEFLPNEDSWSNLYCKMFNIDTVHLAKVTYSLRLHENNSYSNFKSYTEKSEAIHDRAIVYGVFLEKYSNKLNDSQKQYLITRDNLETLRYNKKFFSIMSLSGLEFKEKIRAIFYASELLFNIRVKFSNIFSGW
jgi:glycosyltransferase involved in cell wall biosynthesis